MLITVYGIMIFMFVFWIFKENKNAKIKDKYVIGFSYLALVTRHQIPSKPID